MYEGSFDDLTKLDKKSEYVSEAVDDSSGDDFTEYDKNSDDIFVSDAFVDFEGVNNSSADDFTEYDKNSDDPLDGFDTVDIKNFDEDSKDGFDTDDSSDILFDKSWNFSEQEDLWVSCPLGELDKMWRFEGKLENSEYLGWDHTLVEVDAKKLCRGGNSAELLLFSLTR